ncbi:hypothetical protein B0H10DRAFT_2037791 [Mycena sp. CBHHK59/15]|nr:hypothetical protein B0H10DRAFT_2037791 [Mycena sp. CBHHK59/15]
MSPESHRKGPNTNSLTPAHQCSTLLEDEMTSCSETATHGNPIERCRVHHEQYCTMTKRYKETQKFVDDTFSSALVPTKEDIEGYASISTILEKARMMKKYVNAIREERTGRDIHHRRFFLKVDDGHKIRIDILAKRMTEGVEIRDALEARAMAIYMEDHPAKNWIKEFQTTPLDEDDEGPQAGKDMLSSLQFMQDKLQEEAALRSRREQRLKFFEYILEPEIFWENNLRNAVQTTFPGYAEERNLRDTFTNAWLQYTRRIIFHDPHLFIKSEDKVTLKDLVLDDDFGDHDLLRVALMKEKRLKTGLKWWKDSWTEAIFIKDISGVGPNKNRIKILGGWIYNNSRNIPAPNKVWYHMLATEPPEKDTENRYVRLCCNFDELHTFLVFSALLPSSTTPTFCSKALRPGGNPPDSAITRNHLSLCGVILTDLVNGRKELKRPDPRSSGLPAKTRGWTTWVEMERRAYMFGAIRNEQDEFTTAFLRELRARPDLFAVVTRSDTDPPLKLESFGVVTDQMRMRKFEAPYQPVGSAPVGRGTWEVLRSAADVLYGGRRDPSNKNAVAGYLSSGFNNAKGARGRFFSHKRFPVKYFLILSASPTENAHDLVRQVAWAAFRAHGLVHGNYDEAKYIKASVVLFAKHARERLSFLPEGSWTSTTLVSRN